MSFRKLLNTLTFGSILLVWFAPGLHAEPCRALLDSAAASAPKIPNHLTSVDQSVFYVSERPGRHGGRQIRVRTQGHWRSNFTKYMLAKQGDPRTVQAVLGPGAALYFGFETISDEEMWIPDAAEFNNSLLKVKQKLRELGLPVPGMSFYPENETLDTWDRDYLEQFGSKRALPIENEKLAEGDRIVHLIHDLSYHALGGLLLDPTVLQWASEQTRALLDFVAEMNQNYSNLPAAERDTIHPDDLETISRTLYLTRVVWVDTGTANLGYYLSQYFANGNLDELRMGIIEEHRNLLRDRAEIMVEAKLQSEIYLPQNFVKLSLLRLNHDLRQGGEFMMNYFSQTVMARSLGPTDLAFVQRRADEYAASNRVSRLGLNPNYDLDLVNLTESAIERLCHHAINTRDHLTKAANLLLDEENPAP